MSKYSQILVTARKGSPKNWHNHWLWIDGERVGRMFLRAKSSSDTTIEFFFFEEGERC